MELTKYELKPRLRYRLLGCISRDFINLQTLGILSFKSLLVHVSSVIALYTIAIYFLNSLYTLPCTYLTLLIVMYPFIMFVGVLFYKLSIRSVMSSHVSREKPLIFLLMSIYGGKFSLERTLYSLIKSPSSRFFRGISSIFRFWLVKYYIDGESIDNIVWRNIDLIPDSDLQSYFKELIRIYWIGGDIVNFLRNKLSIFFNYLRELWINSWRNISNYLEIIILIFGLTPSILSSLIFLIGYNTVVYTFIILLTLFPFLGFISYLSIEKSNPRLPIPGKYINKYLVFIFFILPISILLHLNLSINLSYAIVYSLTITLLPAFIYSIIRIKHESRIESDLIILMRELEELVKGGFSVVEALKNLDLNKYHYIVRNEIRDIISKYEYGTDVREYIPMRYSSLAFFRVVIGEILYSGGGLKEIIELRDLLESYFKVNSMRRASSILPLATSIGVIFLGGYSVWVVGKILSKVSLETLSQIIGSSIDIYSISFYSRLFLLIGLLYTGLLIDKTVFGSFNKVISLFLLVLSLSILFIFIPI